MDIHLKETIPKVFQPIHKAVQNEGIQEVVAKGGRGSGKSSYLSLELVLQLLRHPDCHAVVLRKVAGTLRNSVYNQVVWAIDALGCTACFRCTVSPMECTYLPTGQKILFFGLDDAGKFKASLRQRRHLLVRGAGPVRRPRGGAQCGAEHFPRWQLQFDFKKF